MGLFVLPLQGKGRFGDSDRGRCPRLNCVSRFKCKQLFGGRRGRLHHKVVVRASGLHKCPNSRCQHCQAENEPRPERPKHRTEGNALGESSKPGCPYRARVGLAIRTGGVAPGKLFSPSGIWGQARTPAPQVVVRASGLHKCPNSRCQHCQAENEPAA